MSWTLLLVVLLALGLALLAAMARRSELKRMERSVHEREQAVRHGADEAQLQHPLIDLSRCLGCGKCVEACPEDGVLGLVHGQAVVINGARCVGVAACERVCPVGAIVVTLSNVAHRKDIPVVNSELEAVGSPDLFLAGEITAHALIKTAVDHGTAVAATVARRTKQAPGAADPADRAKMLDLVIVGAGPAGLACSLEAKRHGLNFVTLDHEQELGGTVARYPRRKLVLTQPIDMPLHGRLKQASYTKEELIELWQRIAAAHQLPIRRGELFVGLERKSDGSWLLKTQEHEYATRNVCLAMGRRGIPRKLDVPGEELSKVAYGLMDAQSYRARRILVVGGGDSAVETAVGLAEQPGNEVTLSYRKEGFFRIGARNEARLAAGIVQGRLHTLLESEVVAIHPETVELAVHAGGETTKRLLPNDEVFVMVGGTPPFELLERSGVSFDPALRPPVVPLTEQGTGLVRALAIGFALTLMALGWAVAHADYYLLPIAERPIHGDHAFLRPGMGAGLGFGFAAAALILLNLLYLVRRGAGFAARLGSLRLWMTSHVATGILAFLCALLHAAMDPRDTVGGHAFAALAVLLLTGAVGRYFYAWVPRAANGRELELAEIRSQLVRWTQEPDPVRRRFRNRVRDEVLALIEKRQWRSSFVTRLCAFLSGQRELHRVLARLAGEGRQAAIPLPQIAETMNLARKAHRAALMAAHYEELRALLNTWRYLHRWVAALMVLLVVVHVVCALAFGGITGPST